MKNFFIVYAFVFTIQFNCTAQVLFRKCYTSCAGLPYQDKRLDHGDLVQNASGEYSYLLFNDDQGNSMLCKVDSFGNTLILKTRSTIPSYHQISPDSTSFSQILPQCILRITDNQFISISLSDSIITNTSSMIYSEFAWLIITAYDSLLNQTFTSRYFLGVPVKKTEIIHAKVLPDFSGFVVALVSSSLNSGTYKNILVAKFDSMGAVTQSRIDYLPGVNLRLSDIVTDVNKNIYLLLTLDGIAGIIKLDSSLNIIWCKEYSAAGTWWYPMLLNFKNISTMTLVSMGDSSTLLFDVDTAFNISNGQLLIGDSSARLHFAFGRGSGGLALITSKSWIINDSERQQDVVLIDSLNQISNSYFKSRDYVSTNVYGQNPQFGTGLTNKNGYLVLTSEGHSDFQWGDFFDIFLYQLGPHTESCQGPLSTPSYYFLSPLNVTTSTVPLQDSIVLLARDSLSLGYTTPTNVLYHMLCSINVGVTEQEQTEPIKSIIYPNPFHAQAKIKFEYPNLELETFQMEIYNTLGLIVRHEEIRNIKTYVLYRNSLPTGMYFYKLTTKNNLLIGSGRFVID